MRWLLLVGALRMLLRASSKCDTHLPTIFWLTKKIWMCEKGICLVRIGNYKHRIDVADGYARIATDDEQAALVLEVAGKYRQATYFLVQAMEKFVRAKIFSLVNPNIEYFRERNRSHSLEDAIEFLVEIVSKNNSTVEQQVKNQLHQHVLGDTQYNQLHNNVRYPIFLKKHDSYSILEVGMEDCAILKNRLASLKLFLNELHRFN